MEVRRARGGLSARSIARAALARAANCRVSGSFSFLSRKFEKNDESGLDAESRRLGKKDRVSN